MRYTVIFNKKVFITDYFDLENFYSPGMIVIDNDYHMVLFSEEKGWEKFYNMPFSRFFIIEKDKVYFEERFFLSNFKPESIVIDKDVLEFTSDGKNWQLIEFDNL